MELNCVEPNLPVGLRSDEHRPAREGLAAAPPMEDRPQPELALEALFAATAVAQGRYAWSTAAGYLPGEPIPGYGSRRINDDGRFEADYAQLPGS